MIIVVNYINAHVSYLRHGRLSYACKGAWRIRSGASLASLHALSCRSCAMVRSAFIAGSLSLNLWAKNRQLFREIVGLVVYQRSRARSI
jgi:hypothetical protein